MVPINVLNYQLVLRYSCLFIIIIIIVIIIICSNKIFYIILSFCYSID